MDYDEIAKLKLDEAEGIYITAIKEAIGEVKLARAAAVGESVGFDHPSKGFQNGYLLALNKVEFLLKRLESHNKKRIKDIRKELGL